MKLKFLLILNFITVMSIAQPSLLSNEMAPFGTNWIMNYSQNFNLADTTIQGANVTWNFSSIQSNSQTLTINVVDPSQTPYGSSFPSANYCYIEGPTLTYVYYNLSSSKMERVGSWRNGTLNAYSDPQTEYIFPLTLGSYNYDTWDNTLSSSGGIYELECIGYGTLILPMGTFNDVLMVRVHLEESFLELDAFFWYSSSNGSVLVQYIPGDGLFIPESLAYTTVINLTSVNESGEFTNQFQYNNPVKSSLSLYFEKRTESDLKYKVLNAMGQQLDAGVIMRNSSLAEIDMSQLSNGLYLLTLQEEKTNAQKTIKVVKQ